MNKNLMKEAPIHDAILGLLVRNIDKNRLKDVNIPEAILFAFYCYFYGLSR